MSIKSFLLTISFFHLSLILIHSLFHLPLCLSLLLTLNTFLTLCREIERVNEWAVRWEILVKLKSEWEREMMIQLMEGKFTYCEVWQVSIFICSSQNQVFYTFNILSIPSRLSLQVLSSFTSCRVLVTLQPLFQSTLDRNQKEMAFQLEGLDSLQKLKCY